MRKLALALIAVALPLGAANAQSMPVSEFLARAEGLQKKGMAALFSRDIGVLKAQVTNSGKALRAEEAAARKAGRKTAYCMPKKAAVQSGELMDYLNAIPANQRAMPMQQAFRTLMIRKYPCPA